MRCSLYEHRCPVCLGDYQAEDKLQQIPACGHTFHMDCIDHWLANHITCPLCRLSLLASVKAPSEPPRNQVETVQESSAAENGEEASVQPRPESCEESQATPLSQSMDEESGTLQNSAGEEQRSECADQGREFRFARNEAEEHEKNRDSSGTFASSWSEHTHTHTSNFNFQDLRFLTRAVSALVIF